MKKVFTIFMVESKDIHIPSTDYYARNNEPQTDNISVLQFIHQADTEVKCENYLFEEIRELYKGTYYIIVPSYIKK